MMQAGVVKHSLDDLPYQRSMPLILLLQIIVLIVVVDVVVVTVVVVNVVAVVTLMSQRSIYIHMELVYFINVNSREFMLSLIVILITNPISQIPSL